MKISCVLTAVFAVSLVLVSSTSIRSDVKEEVRAVLQEILEQVENDAKEALADEISPLHDNFNVIRYRGMKTIGVRLAKRVRTGTLLTAAQQDDIVAAINKARALEGANDMHIIRWNDKLANLAQEWASQCDNVHGTPLFDEEELEFSDVGQNNYAYSLSADFSAANAVKDWMSEKPFFNMASNLCSRETCDRYKQLVWGYTTDVGCGLAACPNQQYNLLVCYFGPPGVYYAERPYAPGNAPCTQCHSGQFFCNNGFCDSTCTTAGPNCECKADCKNCATFVQSSCSCTCKPGSVGVDCSNRCKNVHEYCGLPYWPDSFCKIDDMPWVKEQCPKLCKLCDDTRDPCAARSHNRRKSSNIY